MDVKCNRAALSEAVQLASSIVPNRTPKPILQCAKFAAAADTQDLTVTATDGEILLKYIVPQIQITEPGAIVVPADRMAAILRENNDQTVQLRATEGTTEVIGSDSRFHVFGHDPDDFPELTAPSGESSVQIAAGMLKRMAHLSVFAAARETSRYAINGVLWELHNKKLCMVATDGRRLAKVDGTVTAVTKEAGDFTAIVPVKTMVLMERILGEPEEKVTITFAGNQICLKTTLVELVGNLVQGRFPKYSDVIPAGCDKKAQIDGEALLSAVRRAALLADEQSRGVRLELTTDKLRLFSSTPEAGDAEVTMKVQYSGEQFEIGFNPQYLIDMLRVIEQPELVLEFGDSSQPGLMRAGKDFLYVVMPVTG